MDDKPDLTYEEFMMEPCVTFGKRTFISKDYPYLKEDCKALKDEFLYDVSLLVYGVKDKPVYISHPEDWWESFKDRWYPSWLLKKYPVKYKEYKIEPANVFPQSKTQVENLGRPVSLCVVNDRLPDGVLLRPLK